MAGKLILKKAVVQEEARYDGKRVLRSNTALPAAEVALAYKGLWQVERAFRELKSGLGIQSGFVCTEDRVRGHIMVCFVAPVLGAALPRLLKERGSFVLTDFGPPSYDLGLLLGD